MFHKRLDYGFVNGFVNNLGVCRGGSETYSGKE